MSFNKSECTCSKHRHAKHMHQSNTGNIDEHQSQNFIKEEHMYTNHLKPLGNLTTYKEPVQNVTESFLYYEYNQIKPFVFTVQYKLIIITNHTIQVYFQMKINRYLSFKDCTMRFQRLHRNTVRQVVNHTRSYFIPA